MRWVQVTPSVTLKSYTFFKPLNLSRSNDQKKALINTKYLINYPLLHSILISKSQKKWTLDSLSLSSKPFVCPLVSLSIF